MWVANANFGFIALKRRRVNHPINEVDQQRPTSRSGHCHYLPMSVQPARQPRLIVTLLPKFRITGHLQGLDSFFQRCQEPGSLLGRKGQMVHADRDLYRFISEI
jgi:hypothetical protein